jgi:Raf kinase inhibitor-like YbhB/YbcL family protein
MRLFFRILLGVVVVLSLFVVVMHWRAGREVEADVAYHKVLNLSIPITSTAFSDQGEIPIECTCKGGEKSPGLFYENLTPGAKSYALTLTDPHVPSPAFPLFNLNHWVIYNIDPVVSQLPSNLMPDLLAQAGGAFGKNSLGEQKYVGPCPPIGRHAYVFKVYALDTKLTFATPPSKAELLDAMKGHVLGYGELTGYFGAN